mgnify:CR=1 FL=1
MHILLVEDHKDVARPVIMMLEHDRHQVRWASTASSVSTRPSMRRDWRSSAIPSASASSSIAAVSTASRDELVALGVAIGITIGVHRIISGDSIHHYIIAGYTLVIALTALAPRITLMALR